MKKIFIFIISAMIIFASLSAVHADERKAYSVPYTIMNAYNNSLSMADESKNGNMTVYINEDGTSDYYMNVKARVQDNLIGHIMTLWSIPSIELPTGAPEDYEIEENAAEVLSTVSEKGLDGGIHDYADTLRFKRNGAREEYFYVRISVDAMGSTNQNAKIVMDWENSVELRQSYTVSIDLYNSMAKQPSMGNAAFANNKNALLTGNTLYIATNPVDVSGYSSALIDIRYDKTGSGDFEAVAAVKKNTVKTGTKYDGAEHDVEYIAVGSFELPSYIKKSGIEYIPVKMNVPYTPMDAISSSSGGYLDARIRIDWSTLCETSITSLEQNPQKSSGASSISGSEIKAVRLKSMGVILTADTERVDENTLFSVARTDGENNTYIMSLTNGGREMQPRGSVELSLPYTEGMSIYRINESGAKTRLKPKLENNRAIVLSSTLGKLEIVGLALEDYDGFSDMRTHWAKQYVEKAVDMGLFKGVSDTEFAPENCMTNGMVITVLYRAAGEPQTNTDGDMWYSKAVAWGLENKIIGDYGELPFNPEKNVTREEFCMMICRYHKMTASLDYMGYLDQFNDTGDISSWAKEAFEWAFGNGIINGKSETTLSPKDNATRAEVATMLMRYMK